MVCPDRLLTTSPGFTAGLLGMFSQLGIQATTFTFGRNSPIARIVPSTLAAPPYNHLGLPWMTHKAADAKPVPAGQPVELKFDLLPMSYIFKAGHKLRVTLTFADPQRRDTPPPVTMATFFSSENGDAAMVPPMSGGGWKDARIIPKPRAPRSRPPSDA